MVFWIIWGFSCGWSKSQVEEILVPDGIVQNSASTPIFVIESKDSEVVDEAFGKTSAGLIDCITEKSTPGIHSTTFDIGTGSSCLN